MDPVVERFGLGVGVLIGLTGVTALVGAVVWPVDRMRISETPGAAWARTS
jgi:hypothetical protein